MTESSRFWDGVATGDATEAPYDAATEFAGVLSAITGADSLANRGGVFTGQLNELAVSGTVTPVSVATGRALNTGNWYQNDAITNVAIPTPAASTRIDYIVLRKDWAAQTVRITRIAGVEGGGAPSLVQSLGVTWDVPLATVSTTTGGVITVTDAREYVPRGISIGPSGPLTWLDFIDAVAPAAPSAGRTRLYSVADTPHYRSDTSGDQTLASLEKVQTFTVLQTFLNALEVESATADAYIILNNTGPGGAQWLVDSVGNGAGITPAGVLGFFHSGGSGQIAAIHTSGILLSNDKGLMAKNSGGALVTVILLDGSNNVNVGDDSGDTGAMLIRSRGDMNFHTNGAIRGGFSAAGLFRITNQPGGFNAIFTNLGTADRAISIQDAAGTLALIADIFDFITAEVGTGTGLTQGGLGDHGGLSMSPDNTNAARFEFIARKTPVAVYAEVYPQAGTNGQDFVYSVTTDFGTVGEQFDANSDSIGNTTVDVPAVGALQLIDITAAFTAAAAGDRVGVVFTRAGADGADTLTGVLGVIGIRVYYGT